MSLVGTRPPTVDEWDKYELHHRARLATKPGLTGMWQVSGRSNITDFEEVVKLDKQYISEWTMDSLLDYNRYVNKYVFVVRKEDNARKFIQDHCLKYGISNVEIVEIDYMTDGQATTCMLAIPYCDKDECKKGC